jgi:hypothetical protein
LRLVRMSQHEIGAKVVCDRGVVTCGILTVLRLAGRDAR